MGKVGTAHGIGVEEIGEGRGPPGFLQLLILRPENPGG